jgi:predicted Zn-dependent protease
MVPEVAEDPQARRAQFLRQLATRDLYEWFGISRAASDDEIREAAERVRVTLKGTPMPQAKRAIERAFCDQGEKALLRPDIRRDYDALLDPRRQTVSADTSSRRVADEREARLKAARDRVQHYERDDGHMASGLTVSLAAAATLTELQDERAAATGISDATVALTAARAARVEGAALRALALAERAHELSPTAGTLRTLGAAHRDLGAVTEAVAFHRRGVEDLPTLRDNSPGWAALCASLLAAGELAEAERIALDLVNDDEEEPHGWRLLALVSAAQADTVRSAEAFERSARLGFDPAGALAGLQSLRKESLARGDRTAVADLESRIARLRSR